MTYTNDGYWTVKAKKWIEEERNTVNPGNLEVSFQHGVLAFASFLDGEEEKGRTEVTCSAGCSHRLDDVECECFCHKPRKEERPVCACGGERSDLLHHGKKECWGRPPQVVEELSGGVVYADARDEVSKKIAEHMARKIIELQNKLNEVIRRLNTITK